MPILILPIARAAPEAIEALLDAAFGADRHRRTAYLLRKGVAMIPELSFAAFDRGLLVGVVQCWPVELVPGDGDAVPLVLLGPVAVSPERQQHGIGRTLMRASLATADAIAAPPLMLIGDPEYYERLFGFHAAPTSGWELPGPFERRRLLVRLTGGRTLPPAGHVRPRGATPPVQLADAMG
ncbi:MAG: N-acetyltransferase [Sphingomonas bacterium]|nr:N-acetyltransferase [Sphingomonas bacterium]MDB5688544.1 N-acetyltransferase [Sphingomonas bacterium]